MVICLDILMVPCLDRFQALLFILPDLQAIPASNHLLTWIHIVQILTQTHMILMIPWVTSQSGQTNWLDGPTNIHSPIHLCLYNCRSLTNKLIDFQNFVYSSNYNLIGLTETWLDSNILDNEILPKGYIIYRRDRCTRGGGVLIAFEGSVSSQLIDCPTELKLLLIQIGIKHPTRICLVYNPPNSCVEYKQSLIAYLDNLASNPSPLIVMGGFNVPDIYWNMLSGSTTLSNQLCDLVFQYDLSQIVDCPTHICSWQRTWFNFH